MLLALNCWLLGYHHISLHLNSVLLCIYYRPPSSGVDYFSFLSAALMSLNPTIFHKYILLGDFNVYHCPDSPHPNCYFWNQFFSEDISVSVITCQTHFFCIMEQCIPRKTLNHKKTLTVYNKTIVDPNEKKKFIL